MGVHYCVQWFPHQCYIQHEILRQQIQRQKKERKAVTTTKYSLVVVFKLDTVSRLPTTLGWICINPRIPLCPRVGNGTERGKRRQAFGQMNNGCGCI